jgi:glycosyltransferase involved in cell wall biosynthesis
MRIARKSGVPFVLRPMGMLNDWSLRQKALKKKCYLRLIERANLNAASAVQAMSAQEKIEIARLGFPGRIAVIPHGITPSPLIPGARKKLREELNLPENERILLFMSRFDVKKGLDLLIPALGRLKEEPFTLVLAGKGDDPAFDAEILRLIRAAGLAERTLLPGFVSGPGKDLYLQGSDLFVLTSYDENFGVAVLEALAAGLPALVTQEVALSEFVARRNLGLVVGTDVARIEEAVRALFDGRQNHMHPGEKERIRREALSEYHWGHVAELLTGLYRDIIAGSSRTR